MSAADATAATEIKEAPRRRVSLPHNTPEWINAASSVGMLLIGVTTLWTTVRVSGLEDYFRSELAMRNQMIASADAELRGLQQELATTSASVEAARSRASALEAESQSLEGQVAQLGLRGGLLASQNAELAREAETMRASADALGKENAMREFSTHLLLSAPYVTIDLIRAEHPLVSPVNPGQLIFAALLQRFERNPSDNPYTHAIFAQLEQRCAAQASTPIEFGPMTLTQPSAREYSQRNVPPRVFLTQEAANRWEQERDAYNERWRADYRAYEVEVARRTQLLSTAQQAAWDAIYTCAADIIGASHQQY